MDLLERQIKGANRHPWELSRADCVSCVFAQCMKHIPSESVQQDEPVKIADIGAGDRFFANRLLERLSAHSDSTNVRKEGRKEGRKRTSSA